MSNILQIPKIEKRRIHDYLYFIKDSANSKMVGYVNKDINEEGWFFFVKDFVSDLYDTSDDAIRGLCEFYITKKYDRAAEMAGVLKNEEYVQR